MDLALCIAVVLLALLPTPALLVAAVVPVAAGWWATALCAPWVVASVAAEALARRGWR